MADSPFHFTTDEEFVEELEKLEEKFYSVGLSRREFIDLCQRLRSRHRDEDIRLFIAALQLPPELPSEWTD